jgi:hypothetical protein
VAFTVALLVVAPMCLQGVREDELQCEEASAHLDNCCPHFDPTEVGCTHGDLACGERDIRLTVDESQCLRSLDCEQIRERELCERVEHVSFHWEGDAGYQPDEEEALCP